MRAVVGGEGEGAWGGGAGEAGGGWGGGEGLGVDRVVVAGKSLLRPRNRAAGTGSLI